jgi:hypothetical protein
VRTSENEGHHLLQFFELNQPLFIPGTRLDGRPLSTVANKDTRRPFTSFSSILDSSSLGLVELQQLEGERQSPVQPQPELPGGLDILTFAGSFGDAAERL